MGSDVHDIREAGHNSEQQRPSSGGIDKVDVEYVEYVLQQRDKVDVVRIDNGILHGIKKNEVMPSAPAWTDLETVILGEASQAERQNHGMTPLL